MIDVKLIAWTDKRPLELASHAALKCYQAEEPKLGEMIDVEKRLFNVGHHTTLEHTYFTFSIEGVAVGDVTFGLHLAHPFYNTDQRSGRFCAEMFTEPDWERISEYLNFFWPDLSNDRKDEVVRYIMQGVDIFRDKLPRAVEIAKQLIKQERPKASDRYIAINAPKIAQEQMRMFVPIIFPTGLDYTIDLITLASMYRTAWSPPLRFMVDQMVREVVNRMFSEVNFMFSGGESHENWSPGLILSENCGVKTKPVLELLGFDDSQFKVPGKEMMHPVDLLHFMPIFMDNSTCRIATEVAISTATMGQDQRHRTIARSKPHFTGDFYLPPILKELGLEKTALELFQQWFSFKFQNQVPSSLFANLAPYGAMVSYRKDGSLNAVLHEQGKRLCWCAQEEIYHLGRCLREAISTRRDGSPVLWFLEPPCRKTGKCGEGARYCGRFLGGGKDEDYFPLRKV